jgi:rhodanese-related sulfurtransferase
MERTIKPDDLKRMIRQAVPVVLDVRRKNDYDADTVRLPGAQWRNPEELAQWAGGLPRDREVVVYCARGGSVSNAVIDHLHRLGLRARYIEGGIEGWKAAGGETVGK